MVKTLLLGPAEGEALGRAVTGRSLRSRMSSRVLLTHAVPQICFSLMLPGAALVSSKVRILRLASRRGLD